VKKKMILLSPLLFTLVVGAKAHYDTTTFKVEQVFIETTKLHVNDTLTILQLSDMHNKVFDKNNMKLLAKIKELNPHIIVITGDLIDRKTTDLTQMKHFIKELSLIHSNIYYISGNHEWTNPLREELFAELQKNDIQILDNTNTSITTKQSTIQLAGIADSSTNHDDISSALNELDPNLYTILLAHTPQEEFNASIDLILSGHTHGGQIRLPFIGAIIAPGQDLFPTLDKGLFQLTENQHLYIDSGLGTSVLPIRFMNQSQLSFITINGVKK
jgi:uncharacterized protein